MTDEPWARDLQSAAAAVAAGAGPMNPEGTPSGGRREPSSALFQDASGGSPPSNPSGRGGGQSGGGKPGNSSRGRGTRGGRSHAATLVQPEWDRSKEL
jgi:hypothetical protein